MSEAKFELSPMKDKPSRKYRKGSKYDPVIDKFLEGENELVSVEIGDRDANYMRARVRRGNALKL